VFIGVALALTTQPAVCSPTPSPYPKNYNLVSNRGAYWEYNAPQLLEADTSIDNLPNNKAQGIKICKSVCQDNINCQTFNWLNYSDPGSTPSFQPLCSLSSAPYDPKYWFFQTDTTASHPSANEVYTVTNFKYPAEILVNGDFESGCFPPWQAYSPNANVTTGVFTCKKGECAPNGPKNYVHMFGTPTILFQSTVSISNEPVIHDGGTYKVTCWVLGTIGILNFYDVTYNATGKWQKISNTLVFHYGDEVDIEVEYVPTGHRTTGPFDWKINGCEMSRVH
jgi:hypothetical protein